MAWDGEGASWGSWSWGCSWWRGSWEVLCGDEGNLVVARQRVSLTGLGSVGLGIFSLCCLNWMKKLVYLSTEVLGVVVVAVVMARHLVFLFLLGNDDDFWNAAAGFLFLVGYVDLFDVGWLRLMILLRGDVDLWSADESTN